MPIEPEPETQAAVSAARSRAIIAVVRAIPPGEVRSYAEVARAAGWPRHARLVARVLSETTQARLPWHRVLRADGCIAFPTGSPAWCEQAERLRAEGVELTDGRVRRVRKPHAPDRTLDAELWRVD